MKQENKQSLCLGFAIILCMALGMTVGWAAGFNAASYKFKEDALKHHCATIQTETFKVWDSFKWKK